VTFLNSVLIVDDEVGVRSLMARWALSVGLQPLTAANADEAIELLRRERCDLAIIDVMMPGRNGIWLADKLRQEYPQTAVVLATGFADQLNTGAGAIADLLIKPFKRERFLLALDRGREWRRHVIEDVEWHNRLEHEVEAALARVLTTIADAIAADADDEAALVAMTQAEIPSVCEHCERVARYTVSIARELGVDGAQIELFESAARYHDIGKLVIPESVLGKPSPLTSSEAHVMRRHVETGAEILRATTRLGRLATIVRSSHEWFGGTGYPDRLAGVSIPLGSRIIAVADAYDAMTQDRLYRSRLDAVEAVAELLRCTPTQFDPDAVVACLNVLGRH
jgi:putative two-component system response regulator